ncbi:hypothetical protein JL722_1386 [Aureococcus anophagefferens]|nr:hypothetical protein JL722_1386 [Aureococcus anophagefferens]
MLDEECVVPRGSDGGYLSKLFKAHEKHANFERCKPKEAQARTSFAVIHYAARVKYGTTGFLEKNRDRLLDGLVLCGGASTDAVVASLFAADAKELGSGKKSKKVKTLGANFRGQLRDLVDALNACEPHFVRCIKPNSVKRPRVFTAPMVQSQMRCAGVLEVCKIRRAGFPFRSKFADFERRYHYIDVAAKGCPSLVAGLEKQRILLSGEWALGKTRSSSGPRRDNKLEAAGARWKDHAPRAGLRPALPRALPALHVAPAHAEAGRGRRVLRRRGLRGRAPRLVPPAARRQAPRGLRAGLAFKEESKALQAIIGECRSAMDRRDVAALDASVAKLKAAGNASLASVLEAAALCHRLKHEPEVRAALVAAARAEDAAALKAALDEARAMGMAGPAPGARGRGRRERQELGALLKRAQELDAPAADVAGAAALLASLQKQLEIVNRAPGALDRARDSRDLAELRALLRDAAAAGVPAADLRDCADFVAAVEREVEALAALDAATKQASSFSKPLETRRDGLAAALDGAAACERRRRFEAASKILARLDEELACVRDVEAAVAGDGDLGDRIAALAAALEGAEDVYHGTRRRGVSRGEDAGQAEAYGKKVDRLAAAVEGLKKAAARATSALNGVPPSRAGAPGPRARRGRARGRGGARRGRRRARPAKNDAPSLDRCEDLAHVVRRELAARRDLAEAADRRDADLLTAALAAARASARVVAPECAVARRVADRLADEADAAGALAAAADARDADAVDAAAVAADVRAADEAERVAADERAPRPTRSGGAAAAARSTTAARDDVDALDAALADAAAALVDGAALDRGRAARGRGRAADRAARVGPRYRRRPRTLEAALARASTRTWTAASSRRPWPPSPRASPRATPGPPSTARSPRGAALGAALAAARCGLGDDALGEARSLAALLKREAAVRAGRPEKPNGNRPTADLGGAALASSARTRAGLAAARRRATSRNSTVRRPP